jgi:DNA-binding transcriptional ArsR family regulator
MPPTDDQVYELHATVCRALAHPARLKVLDCLREGEECVCRLAPQVGVTEANLSQLLASLRQVGLVETRRDGHAVYYRVRDQRIFDIIDQMRAMLADQLSDAQHLALQV